MATRTYTLTGRSTSADITHFIGQAFDDRGPLPDGRTAEDTAVALGYDKYSYEGRRAVNEARVFQVKISWEIQEVTTPSDLEHLLVLPVTEKEDAD